MRVLFRVFLSQRGAKRHFDHLDGDGDKVRTRTEATKTPEPERKRSEAETPHFSEAIDSDLLRYQRGHATHRATNPFPVGLQNKSAETWRPLNSGDEKSCVLKNLSSEM